MRPQAIAVLVNGAHGIYVPKVFVESYYGGDWENLTEEHYRILSKGPNSDDDESYWDTWQEVLNSVAYSEGGYTWTLHQDGDLFNVCPELMTNEEYENFYGEMKPAPEHAYEFAVCGDCLIAEANNDYSGMDDHTAERVEAGLEGLHFEYQQVIPDGASYGFKSGNCECCGAPAGNRYRFIAFKDPHCIGVQP